MLDDPFPGWPDRAERGDHCRTQRGASGRAQDALCLAWSAAQPAVQHLVQVRFLPFRITLLDDAAQAMISEERLASLQADHDLQMLAELLWLSSDHQSCCEYDSTHRRAEAALT